MSEQKTQTITLATRQAVIRSTTVSELVNLKGNKWVAEFVADVLVDMSGKRLKQILSVVRGTGTESSKKVGISQIVIGHWTDKVKDAVNESRKKMEKKKGNGKK